MIIKRADSIAYMITCAAAGLVGVAILAAVTTYVSQGHDVEVTPVTSLTTAVDLIEGQATPLMCSDDGDLLLTGSYGDVQGTWWIPGACVQSGRQMPECLYFVGFGGDDGTCVKVIMPPASTSELASGR